MLEWCLCYGWVLVGLVLFACKWVLVDWIAVLLCFGGNLSLYFGFGICVVCLLCLGLIDVGFVWTLV